MNRSMHRLPASPFADSLAAARSMASRMMRGFAAGIVLAATLLCSGLSQNAAAAAFDSCALLQKADVEAAFSPRAFDQGTASPLFPGTAKLAAVSSCTYTSQGPSLRDIVSITLLARRSPEGVNNVSADAMKAGVVQLKGTPVDLPDLGDGAFWVNLGSDSHPSYQLNVKVGARYWLVFSTAGVRGEQQLAIESLASLARAVLPRL